MSIFELFVLAVGLCFDTFAVSVTAGVCMPFLTWSKRGKMMAVFALFQGGLAAVGWLLGTSISEYIAVIDHWVAFFLLAFIGGKMLYEGCSKQPDGPCIDLLKTRTLCTVAVATSIDALMVGVSLAMIHLPGERMALGTFIIGLVTAAAAGIGLVGGGKLGKRVGQHAEKVGGVILILIGLKILLEHVL